jgi:hypothetical protein
MPGAGTINGNIKGDGESEYQKENLCTLSFDVSVLDLPRRRQSIVYIFLSRNHGVYYYVLSVENEVIRVSGTTAYNRHT